MSASQDSSASPASAVSSASLAPESPASAAPESPASLTPQGRFASQLEAALAPARLNGVVGLGTFLRGVSDWLKTLALSQIDTEEERDAIVAAVMKVAETLVASKFPPLVWKFVRPSIDRFLDEAIDNLPALIQG